MSTKKLLLRLVAEKFFVSISSPLLQICPRSLERFLLWIALPFPLFIFSW